MTILLTKLFCDINQQREVEMIINFFINQQNKSFAYSLRTFMKFELYESIQPNDILITRKKFIDYGRIEYTPYKCFTVFKYPTLYLYHCAEQRWFMDDGRSFRLGLAHFALRLQIC
ncbi:hypothetical protein Bhyg_13909 [Pseudolycoriella hygida]|uniref:Uncharacterized protein n=1 Tax=Pseudolycoriella hygida TaxID=35572 RepID=A0A9Q0MQX8_9DIPT|nr:hypothetical protein Bhyg_13909 [Pseudolycoriella hygida]